MQSGNGIELAAVYQLLTEVAKRVGAVEMQLTSHTQKLNELAIVVNEHSHKLDQLAAVANEHGRKADDVAAGLRELRLTVHQYHEAVVGQGLSLTRLDERVQRIEEHLHLGPAAG